MLDVLQAIRDEIIDDEEFIASCKDLVDKTGMQATIVWVVNIGLSTRHLMSIPTQLMHSPGWRLIIKNIAHHARADAIMTVVTSSRILDTRTSMTISVETMLDRYTVVYPYRRTSQQTTWQDPLEMELPPRYGDLLPTPEWMATA